MTVNSGIAHSGARHSRVVIVGSGFSGMGLAIRLTMTGRRDFLVLERAATVGGTWRDNTYPGAACDVPSRLYSFSFAPGTRWSRSYASGGEIQSYLEALAQRYALMERHVFGCEVTRAVWEEAAGRWRIDTTQGQYTADVLVSAVGGLHEPSLPEIRGINSFTGPVFHSARWNHDIDLEGRRVAVVGTGASAVQIVPSLAPAVQRLDLYQRTPPWVIQRFDRAFTSAEQFVVERFPFLQKLQRAGIYVAHELLVPGLARWPALLRPVELASRLKLRVQVRDPELRAAVTPDFRLGCKRMLSSNAYYPALARDNVDLVTAPITSVGSESITTADGRARTTDAIVFATGYHVSQAPAYRAIVGRDGRSLADVFATDGQQAYKGAAVAGFPNLFMLLGPNTWLGHSSLIHMIESQFNYIVDALSTMDRERLRSVEVRKDRQDRYNTELRHRMSGSVWATGGCSSWYLDPYGNNIMIWPGSTFEFRRRTREFDVGAYRVTGATRHAAHLP